MAKPLGLDQLLKMAEDDKTVPMKVLIQAIQAALEEQNKNTVEELNKTIAG